MKGRILEFLYYVLARIYFLINYDRERVLIYTDSRGYDVTKRFGKNPYASYVGGIIRKYRVDYFICPEKHTTILDFLGRTHCYDLTKYKAIILHCGVVDFSPRPLSNLDFVKNSKKGNQYFKIAISRYSSYYSNPSEVLYKGEKTQTLYSPDFLVDVVLPKLIDIPNLIWINSNHFVNGWEGNFTKGRPLNIDKCVNDFDNLLYPHLHTIDLKKWSSNEVKAYTVDNIHFSSVGFKKMEDLILKEIEKKVYQEIEKSKEAF